MKGKQVIVLLALALSVVNAERGDFIVNGQEVYDHPVTMAQASAAAWLQDATTGKIYCGATWFRTSSPQRHVMTMDTCVTNGPAMSNIIVHLRDRNRALGSDQQCEFSTRVSAMQAVAGTPLYVLRLTDALPNSRLDSNGNRCRRPARIDCGQNAWGSRNRIESNVYGWGSVSANQDPVDILRYTTVKARKSTNANCRSQFPGVTASDPYLCASRTTEYYGACYGDGGSPLLDLDSLEIIGVVANLPENCGVDTKWSLYVKMTTAVCNAIDSAVAAVP